MRQPTAASQFVAARVPSRAPGGPATLFNGARTAHHHEVVALCMKLPSWWLARVCCCAPVAIKSAHRSEMTRRARTDMERS
jgi:hypothetical protein